MIGSDDLLMFDWNDQDQDLQTMKLIGGRHESQGLYYLSMDDGLPLNFAAMSSSVSPLQLHCQMRHSGLKVGETISGKLNEEDHIVPYPTDTEEEPVLAFEDCNKKQRNADANTVVRSTGLTSGAKSEFLGCNLENSSSLDAKEEQFGPRLDMDAWPDFPSINAELSTGELSLNKSYSSLAGRTVHLDGESGLFGNAPNDKENDSFLDCEWDNIGDFDDFNRIFRNDSIFGHDMVTNVDDFLSLSADMIGSVVEPIPMPEIPLSRDQPSDRGCSSIPLVEHSGGKRKAEDKTADTVENREQTTHQTPNSKQLTEKDDRKNKLLKSRKKAEERSKNKASQILNGPWTQNICQNQQQFPGQNAHLFLISPSQTIPSPSLAPQSKIGNVEPMENIGCSNQHMHSQYGYPAYLFTGTPVLQHVQAEVDDISTGHNLYLDPQKYSNTSNVVPEIQSKPLGMTPQEKIEKLRRRQQAHAMLAIQQQQLQFGHQVTGAENIVAQENFQRNMGHNTAKSDVGVKESENNLPPSDLNLLLEQDSSQRTSTLTDDASLEKTIYYQLQDALRKLDVRVRLSIRDSLFRLSKSSMERQNACDRSSTNKSTRVECEVPANEEESNGKRHTGFPDDTETYTNPIDRTVAHLLFHRPLESCTRPMNIERPQSSSLHNPAPKVPLNIHGSMNEGEPKSFGEMDM